jgi:general secretion pathway protein D/MSHA biogenesis protein MshL
MEFGANGQVWPGSGQFVSNISLDPANFTLFLNALNEQGNAKILSNPRLSVMNGQPALLTVGRNVTYIDEITSDVSGNDSGTISYTATTSRALSGVGLALTANILDNNEIILNLVPVTSELEEPIEYRSVGDGEIGLPIINVREISTTVRVKNNDMLVIGGLISDSNNNTSAFAPGLGSVPVLKYLFGYEEKKHTKRELIVLLKPRII